MDNFDANLKEVNDLIDADLEWAKERKEMRDLIERFSNFDCFQPWGIHCSKIGDSGEEPCEACQAKEILNRTSAMTKN